MEPDPLDALLSPGAIGALTLRNRILMAPMGTNLAEQDGTVGERSIAFYEARAKGGAALLTVGSVGVSWPRGATNPNQVALSNDSFLPGIQTLAQRVHEHGAKVALQLHHGGRNAIFDIASQRTLFTPSRPRFRGANDKASAFTEDEARAVERMRGGGVPKFAPATQAEIDRLIKDFADAADRARHAGIDGVEIHAAHGYAIAGFLSPAWNFREDQYGGSPAARAKLLVEVLHAVRERVGNDFPVWVRLDACEFRVPGGLILEDAKGNAVFAEAAGADAVHVSAYSDGTSGIGFTEGPLVHKACGYADFAAEIKRSLSIPVIAVGRIEPQQANGMIERGEADFVAMGRKLIADPDLPNKLNDKRSGDVRPCIYCYRCVGEVCVGQSVRCAVNPLAGREFKYRKSASAVEGHVVVIGGGPGGMEAARAAAQRGFAVTLLEGKPRLGGRLLQSAHMDPEHTRLIEWYERQLQNHDVRIRLNTPARLEDIVHLDPDSVVIATGGLGRTSSISQQITPALFLDASSLSQASLASLPAIPEGEDRAFVILGAGLVGIQIAEWVSARRANTIVLEEGTEIGSDMALPRRWRSLHLLRERGVEIVTQVTHFRWDSRVVRYEALQRGSGLHRVDVVIDARNLGSNPNLETTLRAVRRSVHTIGDANGGNTIEAAILDGFTVGQTL